MAAKDDWIEDVRRWCFEAPLADVEAMAADVAISTGGDQPPGFASPDTEGSPAIGPTAFMPYARGSGFDRALSGSPHDFGGL